MRLAIIAACITAALALAACGKSSKSSSTAGTSSSSATTTATPTSTAAAAKSQALELYDYRFNPKTVKAKPGQKITLQLKNEGKTEHNFSVASLHIDKDVPAGKKASVTVTLPKSGTLQFFCSYHKASHKMVGAFTAGGASAPPTNTNTSTGSSGSGY